MDPRRWWRTAKESKRVLDGGGPSHVRLRGVGRPEGWIFTFAPLRLEIEARDGTIVELEPGIPLPFPYAWAYRLADHLGVPVVSDVDPERIAFELPLPG